jgi:copper chaperone CopZ
MKRSIGFACILAIVAGCNEQPAVTNGDVGKSERTITFNTAGAPTVEFALPNLVCDDEECALAVKDILARQPGTEDVLVDVEAKRARVAVDEGKFDSQVALAELRAKGFDLEPTAAAAFNPTGAPTIEFAVPDMMCEDGCAWTVKDILSKQPGARDVRVDFEAKSATVAFDEGAFDAQLAIAELVDKGFNNSQVINEVSESSRSKPSSHPFEAQAKEKPGVERDKKEKTTAFEQAREKIGT